MQDTPLDGTATLLANEGTSGPHVDVGQVWENFPPAGLTPTIQRTGAPARIDDYRDIPGGRAPAASARCIFGTNQSWLSTASSAGRKAAGMSASAGPVIRDICWNSWFDRRAPLRRPGPQAASSTSFNRRPGDFQRSADFEVNHPGESAGRMRTTHPALTEGGGHGTCGIGPKRVPTSRFEDVRRDSIVRAAGQSGAPGTGRAH